MNIDTQKYIHIHVRDIDTHSAAQIRIFSRNVIELPQKHK